mmetsp:Transcript_17193/g.47180  ORF Transcript_17193/g.47180 Transcript_17193/m.47180 type:complete len:244 (+) Transcript_17193:1052-1783(+)
MRLDHGSPKSVKGCRWGRSVCRGCRLFVLTSPQVQQALRMRSKGLVASGDSDRLAPPNSERKGWKTVHVYVGNSVHFGGRQPPGGPAFWVSEAIQTMYVMRLLGFPRRGFFVDMGAFEAVDYSNSLSLELYYDWDGICVEAGHRQLWSLSHRRCRVVYGLLSDGQDATYDTRSSDGHPSLSGIVSSTTDNAVPANAADTMKMPTVTIAKMLRDMGAPRDIDYMCKERARANHFGTPGLVSSNP